MVELLLLDLVVVAVVQVESKLISRVQDMQLVVEAVVEPDSQSEKVVQVVLQMLVMDQGPEVLEVTHPYQVVLRDQELLVKVEVVVIMLTKQVELPVVKVDRQEIVLTMVEMEMEQVDQEVLMDQQLEELMVI